MFILLFCLLIDKKYLSKYKMAQVMSSNGYGALLILKTLTGICSACTQQEANAKVFQLFTKASLLSDPVAVDLDIIQSQGPGYYMLKIPMDVVVN